MRQHLTFAGRNLADFGVYISGSGVFNAPEKLYETIEIPGRNGTLLGADMRLDNIELTYPAFCFEHFAESITALKGLLLSQTGFKMLQDTYYPDQYRLAYFPGPLEVDPSPFLEAGEFELTFICKPQRFLTIGLVEHDFTKAGSITNPSDFPSQPLITVYGFGTVTIGDTVIEIAETENERVTIDCEAMTAYSGRVNLLSSITLSGNDFPVLNAGENVIDMSGPSLVQIVPRWWVL